MLDLRWGLRWGSWEGLSGEGCVGSLRVRGELGAGACEARFDGAWGDAQGERDLFDGEFFDVVEVEHVLAIGGETCEGVEERVGVGRGRCRERERGGGGGLVWCVRATEE